MDEVRETLEQLIRDKGDDYSALSRLLGRNAAYVQQFMKRGTPKHLHEDDRRILARYYGVDETVLGGPRYLSGPVIELIPVYDVRASAGHGALAEAELRSSQIAFEGKWLKKLTASSPSKLSIISVAGDSMEPTLFDGDDVLLDLSDDQSRLRDGIYVLRRDDALSVKRIALDPSSRKVSIVSDNSAYPVLHGIERKSLHIVGRVLWVGRKLQ
jgi:phage repressor protein C with HTH and peptisase S24 domain